jgi:hypothetical protein
MMTHHTPRSQHTHQGQQIPVQPTGTEPTTQRPQRQRQAQLMVETTVTADWCHWGDIMPHNNPSRCRIVLQNINGIQNKTSLLGYRANELRINILGLVETNVDWQCSIPSKFKSKQAITGILRQFWKRTCIAYSSSDHRPKFFFQPGGTMTIAGNPWASRAVATSDESGMGRWSSIKRPRRYQGYNHVGVPSVPRPNQYIRSRNMFHPTMAHSRFTKHSAKSTTSKGAERP